MEEYSKGEIEISKYYYCFGKIKMIDLGCLENMK